MRATSPPDGDDLGPCPTGADLVCVSSGELPADEWRIIGPHVKRCAACQAQLRTIHGTIDAWARYQARVAASAAVRDSVTPPRPAIAPVRDVRRWLAFAAALVALVLTKTIAHTPPTTTAYADEILARLARQETVAHARPRTLLWTVRREELAAATRSTDDSAGLPARIYALLEAHGFDPNRPLSAGTLLTVRGALPTHGDRVWRDRGHLIIQATVQKGALREWELVIDEARDEIVKQTWVFASAGRVECERLVNRTPRGERADETVGGAR